MFTLLSALAYAADPPPPPGPTRVTAVGNAAVVHLELPTGTVELRLQAQPVTLQGPLVVDLFDTWAMVKNPVTNQVHVVPRESVVYVGTGKP